MLVDPDPLKDALICPLHGHDKNAFSSSTEVTEEHCPSSTGSQSNQTTPVCQYDPTIQDYQTICVKIHPVLSSSSQPSAVVQHAHAKSYCGVCKRCFDDHDELQAAVQNYKSRTHIDTDLAQTYGWPIGNWCVDKVTSFSNLFLNKKKFNEGISKWDTSRVTDMMSM